MTTPKNEHISGLMDEFWADEKARESGLQTLHTDPEAKAKWARYHLIRDAMQDDIKSPLDAGFASRVSAALEDEPAIVAFPAQHKAVASGTSDIADLSSASAKPVKQRVSRNVIGFSVAATVAVVSLLGLNVFQASRDAGVGSKPVEIAQVPATAVSTGQIVDGQLELVSNPVGSYWVDRRQEAVSPEFASRLNMYLSEHIESSSTSNVKGMLPYSRLAGFDTRRPQAETQ